MVKSRIFKMNFTKANNLNTSRTSVQDINLNIEFMDISLDELEYNPEAPIK